MTIKGYTRSVLESSGVTKTRATPATHELFSIDETAETLDEDAGIDFHSKVMTLFYLASRARPDILTAVAFLTTRVSSPTVEDLGKLTRVLQYLNGTASMGMRIKPYEDLCLFLYVDASFAVHKDMRSQTGAVLTLGAGPVYVASKKQGLVTKSSTEAELVGLADMTSQMIWALDFLIDQGMEVPPGVLYQDNTSTMKLTENGRSKSARTRHIGIRFFFVKERIGTGEVRIEYKPTGDMIADYLTKPLQGELFRKMRAWLLGMDQ